MLTVATAHSAAEFDNAKGSRRKAVREEIFSFNTIVRVNERRKVVMVSVPEYAHEYRARKNNPAVGEVKRIARLLQETVGVSSCVCKYAQTVEGGRTHYVFAI